jgi:hypothetical protein
MNEQEIDALEGRELDLAIERYVFGRETPPTDKWCWIQKDDGTWWSEQQDCIDGEWLRSWDTVYWPPEYHSSDYLAFKVVDKVLEYNDFIFHLESGNGWFAIFTQGGYIVGLSLWYEVRASAICHSALKAVTFND